MPRVSVPLSSSLLRICTVRGTRSISSLISRTSRPVSKHPRTHRTPFQPTILASFATMSTATSMTTPKLEATDIPTSAGTTLTQHQRTLLLSVLDLFAGRPSLPKLRLWTDTATFKDPLTQAEGHAQIAAQWYGLAAAFSKIERLDAECVDSGNPMRMKLKMRYTVKGIGATKEIESEIVVKTEEGSDQGKIVRVEDRWNGDLPEGSIAKAFQRLNAVSVPLAVKVPKTDEEDREMGFQ